MVKKKGISEIFMRYIILLIVAVFGIKIFHYLFLPLTLYPVYFLLNLFFDSTLIGNTIFILNFPIEIIGACVAGSAYYFLLILNLSTKNIKIKKRLKIMLVSFGLLLVINILRIFVLSLLYLGKSSIFDFAHKLFWYLGSTIFVVLIWFMVVKIYKIKEIPFYSDIKYFYKQSLLKKKS